MPPPYQPAGVCIYCGTKRYSIDRNKLGAEHIVPYCLDGEEILPEASCKKCEGKTGGVEQHLFGDHGHYRAARVVAGCDSREKGDKAVPLYLSPTFEKGKPTGGQRVDLPPNQSGPRYVSLVILSNRPAVLKGVTDISGEAAYPGVELFFTDLARPAGEPSSYGLPHFSPPGMDLVKFFRFLAKVAHAHAAAELGLDGFRPLLTDLIRGKEAQMPWGLFGHHNDGFFPGGNFQGPYHVRHSVQSVGDTDYVVVDIGILFKAPGFPRYSVVAGTIDRTAHQIREVERERDQGLGDGTPSDDR